MIDMVKKVSNKEVVLDQCTEVIFSPRCLEVAWGVVVKEDLRRENLSSTLSK